MPLFQRKLLLFVLGIVIVSGFLSSTLALGRMSRWIVFHDAVWAQMDREGAAVEHGIAEIFVGAGAGFLFVLATIVVVAFLALLWHTLFRAR